MGKYDGICKVNAELSVSMAIQNNTKKPTKNYWLKSFLINLCVCATLCLCIFSGKFLPIPKYDEFTKNIKTAICFDVVQYIKDKVKN